jgi:MerR family transcriptional regulator, light-induced transcriptional regulator
MMTNEERCAQFTEALLQGDRRRCYALVREWEDQQLSDETLYSDILIPALAHVGNNWESNNQSIVVEHVATQIVKQILAYKAFYTPATARNGRTAMVGCVPNEHHDVASTMLSNLLERDGWHVLNYGASVPKHDLIRTAREANPDLLCFTMKSVACLEETEELLRDLRQALPSATIMLGGLAVPEIRGILAPYVNIFADSLLDGAIQARALQPTTPSEV